MSTTPEPVEPQTAADTSEHPPAADAPEPTAPAADPQAQPEEPTADAQPQVAADDAEPTAPAADDAPAEAAADDAQPEAAADDAQPAPQEGEAAPAATVAPDAPSADAPTAPPPAAVQAPAQDAPAPDLTGTATAADRPEGAEDAPDREAVVPPTADAQEPAGQDDAESGEGAEGASGGKRRRKKKGKGGGDEQPAQGAAPQEQPKKRKGPEPSEVMARIGTTNDQALAYLADPDPKLSRLSRKVTEALLPDLHPVTAGALLGPAGFTRHLVASAAAGRYRDLFVLWETFRRFPAEAKPELAERSKALSRAQEKLNTAVRIGLTGRSAFLAEDIARAEGLIWQWLREALVAHLPAVGARPAVASALLKREPGLEVPLPPHPDERWLDEAAAARQHGPLADAVETLLGQHVHRLPATVDTLRLATVHYPERVPALVDRVDLDAPDIGAFLAWARDHGAADRLHGRIRERVAGAAARDRAEGLARWYSWQQRGVALELPEALRTDSLEGFDLSRPETAELAARLLSRGVDLDLQRRLDEMAGQNRQLAEKAYEAMVCADLPVTLPAALEDNPVVNPGTRCPKCRAWTWVRPGHEARCPRPEPTPEERQPDPFELAAAEAAPAPAEPAPAAAAPSPAEPAPAAAAPSPPPAAPQTAAADLAPAPQTAAADRPTAPEAPPSDATTTEAPPTDATTTDATTTDEQATS